jgi:hypothetical protein
VSNPDDIPQVGIIPKWADEIAGHVVASFMQGGKHDAALLHGAFAAALVQERERCAKIAVSADRPGRNTGSLIAAAIRGEA